MPHTFTFDSFCACAPEGVRQWRGSLTELLSVKIDDMVGQEPKICPLQSIYRTLNLRCHQRPGSLAEIALSTIDTWSISTTISEQVSLRVVQTKHWNGTKYFINATFVWAYSLTEPTLNWSPICYLSYQRLAQHIAKPPEELLVRCILPWCPARTYRNGATCSLQIEILSKLQVQRLRMIH